LLPLIPLIVPAAEAAFVGITGIIAYNAVDEMIDNAGSNINQHITPAPAQEPIVIPQEPVYDSSPYISQQGTDYDSGPYVSPQNPSIESQPYVDSIPFQVQAPEIITTVPWITFDNIPSGQEKNAVFDTLAHMDAGTVPTDIRANRWGIPFGNREGFLPAGNYREYTVIPDPATTNRGVRRIVKEIDTEATYYTWTHYGNTGNPPFVRIR
jgi:hypothetical protein